MHSRRQDQTTGWNKTAAIVLSLAVIVTLYFAFKPGHVGGGLFPWDKADHFCAFFTLTVLALAAFPNLSLVAIGVTIAAFGGAIELIQGTPLVHRDCDFWDWVAELCAMSAVFGTVAAAKVRRFGQPRNGIGSRD